MLRSLAVVLTGLLSIPAAAQVPAQDFSGLNVPLAQDPVEIMVLGTAHLSKYRDEIDASHLEPLLQRLEAFAPDIIAIEATSGQVCEMLRMYEASYPGVAADYCVDPGPARTALEVTGPEAERLIAEALDTWPSEPTPDDRRRLAALFYAAGEPNSALVQWFRLQEDERRTDAVISQELLEAIETRASRFNENVVIAAALAARLGHERVVAADDRSADDIVARRGDALWNHMRPIWDSFDGDLNERYAEMEQGIDDPARLLAFYRFMNAPETQRENIRGDFVRALQDPGEEAFGQAYAAWWQARGLRMAANIVEAAEGRPGARVLVTVGASHKPYYEAYLDQMHDIEVLSTDTVLAP